MVAHAYKPSTQEAEAGQDGDLKLRRSYGYTERF